MLHRRIIEGSLKQLDKEKAGYFNDLVTILEEDRRTERHANLVYLVLRETMRDIPLYLEKKELANLLLRWVEDNYQRLGRILYDARFIRDPQSIREVTGGFVIAVSDAMLKHYENGGVKDDAPKGKRFSWPYKDTDFPLDEP